MDYFKVIISQTFIMLLLMMIGYLSFKMKLVNSEGSMQISNLVIYIANPALLISSFSQGINSSQLKNSLYMLVLLVGIYIVSVVVAFIFYKRRFSLDRFAIIFANLGFIGIPLAKNVLGNESVIYMSIFVGVSNFVIWTFGVYLVAGSRQNPSIMKLLLNPCIIALVVGLILGLFKIKIPTTLTSVIDNLSNMNLPLVMVVLGCYLAEGNLLRSLKNKRLYLTCIGRLIVIPILLIFMLKFIPNSLSVVKLTILLGSATPVAALMAIFSKQYGKNYPYCAAVVGSSTIFSLVTIPIIMSFAHMIW